MLFLLQGCYQASLTPMLGPVAGASQGKITYSAVSTSVSYGVKHKTGKFPIEHIIKREKDRIVKKLDVVEKELIEKSVELGAVEGLSGEPKPWVDGRSLEKDQICLEKLNSIF